MLLKHDCKGRAINVGDIVLVDNVIGIAYRLSPSKNLTVAYAWVHAGRSYTGLNTSTARNTNYFKLEERWMTDLPDQDSVKELMRVRYDILAGVYKRKK